MTRTHPSNAEGFDQSFDALTMPVYRASTVVFGSTREFLSRRSRLYDGFSYGLYGTPTTRELEVRVAAIEGGTRSLVVPSGLAAMTAPILSLVQKGQEVLVADCVYGPTRDFCVAAEARFGMRTRFIAADAGSLLGHISSQTRLVILESPGSYTMEIQDIDMICREAHGVGALVMVDNTWGFGSSNLFEHGVDIVSTALSKYGAAHSDVCMGSITVRDEALYRALKDGVTGLGMGVSSDDAYLVARGLETLDVRLTEHARRGLAVSRWLRQQIGVETVMYPGDPNDVQHGQFRRYFRRANGLVSFIPVVQDLALLEQALDSMVLFRLGASWGGTSSLVAINKLDAARSISRQYAQHYIIRLHIGLEDEGSIMSDLQQALARIDPTPRP
ncbi:MAG: trans-sulfuration enzyme family protein [Betaproteobacteria bacterium]|jgi:cystathionine beta-lyase